MAVHSLHSSHYMLTKFLTGRQCWKLLQYLEYQTWYSRKYLAVFPQVRILNHQPSRKSQLPERKWFSTSKMASSKIKPGLLVGLGNPLLDITIHGDEDFLKKYDLEPDNAILATSAHQKLFDELITKHEPDYSAGGATQNTIRVAQWFLQKPETTVFFGCVGNDNMGKILEAKAREVGVNVRYLIRDEHQTGVCAAVISGKDCDNRSLISRLGASRHFDVKFLKDTENWKIIQNAEYFYIGGFVFPVSTESIQLLAEHAVEENKALIMNLSATYLCRYFTKPELEIMQYIDVIVGNEQEYESFASLIKLGTEDIKEIAKKTAALPKKNKKRDRIVVVTHGRLPTIVATKGEVKEFPTPPIGGMIVDTVGCGDAFMGGFLAQYVQGKPVEDCMRCGQYAAKIVIQHFGCTFPEKPEYE